MIKNEMISAGEALLYSGDGLLRCCERICRRPSICIEHFLVGRIPRLELLLLRAEPEKRVMSRSGDECVVALTDQW